MSLSGAAPTPRVNFEMLSEYIGKTVRLVGKVESVEGTDLKLRAADEGIVTVHLSDAAPSQAFVEFDAKVDSPTEVSAISCTSFGDSFDLENYNEVCRLMNGEYKSLFA